MTTAFDAAMAAAYPVLDDTFGEGFLFEPTGFPVDASALSDPNGRLVSSCVRPPISFCGAFFNKGALLHAHGRSMADSTSRVIVAEQPMIDIDATALGGPATQGDRIYRDGTGEAFTVTRWKPADLGRAWIYLAERREPASNGR